MSCHKQPCQSKGSDAAVSAQTCLELIRPSQPQLSHQPHSLSRSLPRPPPPQFSAYVYRFCFVPKQHAKNHCIGKKSHYGAQCVPLPSCTVLHADRPTRREPPTESKLLWHQILRRLIASASHFAVNDPARFSWRGLESHNRVLRLWLGSKP